MKLMLKQLCIESEAKTSPPLTANDWTSASVKPESTGFQLVPLSMEWKTPLLEVPAKIALPLTTKVLMSPLQGPLVITH
jgi:hypothetical protein